MQKLILGRALAGDPAATPHADRRRPAHLGLDIGAVAYVHQQLLDACAPPAARAADQRRPRRDLRAGRPHRGDHHGRGVTARPRARLDAGLDRPGDGGAGPRAQLDAVPWLERARGAVARLVPRRCRGGVHARRRARCCRVGGRAGRARPTRSSSKAVARLALRVTETLTRATPLILTGLAAAIAFRAALLQHRRRRPALRRRAGRGGGRRPAAACRAARLCSRDDAAAMLAGALLLLARAAQRASASTRW